MGWRGIPSADMYFDGVELPADNLIVPDGTRSVAVVSGNRNLGLYFAALPADPLFSLFVATYQIPIYLTPMVAGWFGDRADRADRKHHRGNSAGR